ncbi:MAG: hypothetical protein KJ667_10135 [Alphaproteobacteria bacterium]|nr:hypothetical protein [Alphaproteobacteria bacterium]
MFEARYDKDQPAVKAMAQRIAGNSPRVFLTDDDFATAYSQEAVNMLIKGGLLAALRNLGVHAVPASFQGKGRDQPQGLKTSPLGQVS